MAIGPKLPQAFDTQAFNTRSRMADHLIERLSTDHRQFERLFAELERQCTAVERGEQRNLLRLQAIADFLASRAFPMHHAIEDKINTRLLERTPNLSADIYDLTEDHQICKREFATFAASLEKPDADFIEATRSFGANERGHFISEEEIFFPFAANLLGADQWRSIEDDLRPEQTKPIFDDETMKSLLSEPS